MTAPGWNAEDYARHSAAQLDWARDLIGELHLQGGEDVLDVGCGDGKVTAEIAERVPRGSVTGLDSSEAMVSFARERHPPARHPNLRFVEGDASALRFDREFDAVFSNAALHWVKDHRPVLDGLARALRPGGRAVLQMGGEGNAADVLAAIGELTAEPEWAPFFQGFELPYGFHSPEQYRGWLEASGLEARELRLVPKDMIQPGRDGLAAWIRTTWFPFTSRAPEGRAGEFASRLVERYLARHPIDEQGRVHVRMVRLQAHLVKPG